MSEDERDPRLDAAWRLASREEPSPALDAAVRAAARRVAGASGRGQNKHWWYPLAAAASVALLAVGIARLTPPERVEPSVTDMAVAPSGPPGVGARPAAAIDAKAGSPPANTAQEPAPVTPPSGVRAGTGAGEQARQRAQGPGAEAKAQDQFARTAPEPAGANRAALAPLPVPAPGPPPLSEPFPAAATAQPRRETPLEASPAAKVSAQEAAEPMAAQRRMSAARVATADTVSGGKASARTVDDWIKRIRELKNAGRLDEAAKELAAFRSAYGEHADALLPPDLCPIRP